MHNDLAKHTVSPSRTYVIARNGHKQREDGSWQYGNHTFARFTLPVEVDGQQLDNNASVASWYYLNYLDTVSYVGDTYSAEDFTTQLVDKAR